jgi:hypothetical protein
LSVKSRAGWQFFSVGGVSFVANLFRGIEVSYITAFTASLVFASATFIPAGSFAVGAPTMCRDLRRLLLLGSACYLIEASLSIIASFTIIIASLIVRPSTSLLVATAICLPLAFAMRRGFRKTCATDSGCPLW